MLKKLFKKIFASDRWTCARCGTTNYNSDRKCKNCGNMRPF